MSKNPNYIQLGNTGPVGPQGPQGPQGLRGERGLQGAIGQIGPRGQAGEVEINSVVGVDPSGVFPNQTYGTAFVTNSGSSAQAKLNFGIPNGLTGATGPTPELGIGNVSGVDPTGTYPNQIYGDASASFVDGGTSNGVKIYDLNLIIPRGLSGPPITVNDVSTNTLNPGTDASVNVTTSGEEMSFIFDIPRGDKGDTGDIAAIASDLIPETDGLYNVGKSNAAGAGAYFKDGYFSGKFYLSDSTPETTNAIYRDGTTEGLVLESKGKEYKMPINDASPGYVLKAGSTANTLEWSNQALISVSKVKTDVNTTDSTTFPLFSENIGTGSNFQTPQTNSNFTFDATNATLSALNFSGGGASLTALNANNISSGTLGVAQGGTGITSLGAGIATFLGTPNSSNLRSAMTDETGSGSLVFSSAPTLTGLVTAGTNTPVTISDDGVVTVQNNTASTTKTTGALIVSGGVGVSGQVTANKFKGDFEGAVTGNADTATKVKVTVNNTTAENNLIPFVADAATTTGAQDLEMASVLKFNPSSGTLSSTIFSGSGASLTSLNAANIADGTVSDTEFQYLNGVSSGIQAQINGKQASLTFGISDTNVVKCGTGIVDDDFLRINGTTLEGRSATEVLSDIGGQASLTFGISNTNVLQCNANVSDNDFLRIDSTSVEGRSASEVLSDIGAAPAPVRLTGSLNPLVVGTTYIIYGLGANLEYTLPTSTINNEVIIIYCYDINVKIKDVNNQILGAFGGDATFQNKMIYCISDTSKAGDWVLQISNINVISQQLFPT